MDGIDLNLADYLKFLLAFVFVIALIGLVTVVARRLGFGLPANPRNSARRRLAVVESLNIDGKRRLVLIRRDDTEHLVLLGTSTELLVENAIRPPENAFSKALNEAARATAAQETPKPHGPPLPRALTPGGAENGAEKP